MPGSKDKALSPWVGLGFAISELGFAVSALGSAASELGSVASALGGAFSMREINFC